MLIMLSVIVVPATFVSVMILKAAQQDMIDARPRATWVAAALHATKYKLLSDT